MGVEFNTCELCDDSYYEGERIEIDRVGTFNVCESCGKELYDELFPCPSYQDGPKIEVTVPGKESYSFQYPEAASEWGERHEDDDTKVVLFVNGTKRDIGTTDEAIAEVFQEGRKRKRSIGKWRPTKRCLDIIHDYNTKKMRHYLELENKLKQAKDAIVAQIEDEVEEAKYFLRRDDDVSGSEECDENECSEETKKDE
jgi:hypothetical protein